MEPQGTLTKEKDAKLVNYMVEILRLAHSLSIKDLKIKVVEICYQRETPFKNKVLRRSWLKLF